LKKRKFGGHLINTKVSWPPVTREQFERLLKLEGTKI
jgi:hypothetical protein